MWGMIATWRMAHDGVLAAKAILEQQGSCQDAVETAIKAVAKVRSKTSLKGASMER